MTNRASKLIGDFTKDQSTKISGWIRENPDARISEEILPMVEGLRMPSLGEKGDKLLTYLAKVVPKAGGVFGFSDSNFALKAEAIAWVGDSQEFQFLFENYLKKEVGFLQNASPAGAGHQISPKGWAYLDSLRRGNPESHIGFTAMWFNECVTGAWAAIAKGIGEAGYKPLRIDQKQHNNKIDDEIVAAIRRSKFLVADFTGQRGGVYFEAGLAMGLGLPVIWLCRHDHLKETHFDTRQYNFIVWDGDKLTGLTKALKDRIEATIGHGPLPCEGVSHSR